MAAPAAPVLSEDTRMAMVEEKAPAPEKSPVQVSPGFAAGMARYQARDWAGAATAFAALPKPAERKRGDAQQEYVRAQFYTGLALQQAGKLKEAAASYLEVLDFDKFHPLCNMNLGICYLELRQYAKADRAFRDVVRDQSRIPPAQFDAVLQQTRYFWALTWTRLWKQSKDEDRKAFYGEQARLRWDDYLAWFGDDVKYTRQGERAREFRQSLEAK